MAPTYRCPNCGKITVLTRADAGQLLCCMACGRLSIAPSLEYLQTIGAVFEPEPEPTPPEMTEALAQVVAERSAVTPDADLSSVPAAAVVAEPLVRPATPLVSAVEVPAAKPPRRRIEWRRLAAVAGPVVVAGLLGLGISWGVVWLREVEHKTKVEHARSILSVKARGDELAEAGDYSGAHERYQAVEQMAAARPVEDRKVLDAVAQARAEQARVFELLLAKQRQRLMAEARPEAVSPRPGTTLPAAPPIAGADPDAGRADEQPEKPVTPPPPPPVTRPTVIVQGPPPANPLDLPPRVAELPRRPAPKAIKMPAEAISDYQIGESIQRGVDHILKKFDGGHEIGNMNEPMDAGLNVLAVYALAQAGQAIHDPRLNPRGTFMRQVLDRVRELRIPPSYETYTRALRATLLSVHNRPEDKQVLREDVAWLLRAHRGGAYDYRMPTSAELFGWDNSNSQYGLLGVWSAAEAGVEVPRSYWNAVQNHWFEQQCESGEWAYHTGGASAGRPSMTVAGLASLFVTHDYLEAIQYGSSVGRPPFSPAVARGLAWLESGENAVAHFQHDGYSVYGLERVGLASGFKYFGRHDWYRSIAETVVRLQHADGGWGPLQETSYKLLFLSRGRHPLIMNKLRFDGSWANRPRDLANLARFASRELERPINWQVVPIDRDWTDWSDAPILYLASHEPFRLTAEDAEKLRRYVLAGGMLFTHADGGGPRFDAFVRDLGPKLFPGHEWRDLPADHELFRMNFKVDPRPKLRYIGNGARVFMLHSPDDLAQHWQSRSEKSKRGTFEFGVNLFLYAGGKTDLRNRLSSSHVPRPEQRPTYEVPLAHVKYAGAWNPEPEALPRFANVLQFATGYRPKVEPVELAKLDARRHPVAYFTGTAAYTATDAEVAAVRRYVEGGGTLIVTACGGSAEFNDSVATNLFPRAFASPVTKVLPPTHPILIGLGDGMDPLPRPQVRPIVESTMGRAGARVEMLSAGHGRVIHVPLDITSGLLGTNAHSVVGYKAGYAQSLLKNILLWLGDGAPNAN